MYIFEKVPIFYIDYNVFYSLIIFANVNYLFIVLWYYVLKIFTNYYYTSVYTQIENLFVDFKMLGTEYGIK